jgi:hypothetical protein
MLRRAGYNDYLHHEVSETYKGRDVNQIDFSTGRAGSRIHSLQEPT